MTRGGEKVGSPEFSFLDDEDEGPWGADPVLSAPEGEAAFRRWVAATSATGRGAAALLARLRADRPAPGWAKTMFLGASPSHETFVDARYRRSLGCTATGAEAVGPLHDEPPVCDMPPAGGCGQPKHGGGWSTARP